MSESIKVSDADRAVLRELAESTAELAALPAQRKTMDLWSKLNSLQMEKPMV